MSDAMREAKRDLRQRMKAARAALGAAIRAQAAADIAAAGLGFLALPRPLTVSGFLAIGEEIDPGPLLVRLAAEGHRLALPVMVAKGKPLIFRAWAPGEPLETVLWGIREPVASAPVVEPDLLLAPLLAFDRTGHRLGYGGGFYDRTLATLRARRPIVAIGLALAVQEVDRVPHLAYDERLDWVLTPEGPIRCAQ